MMERVSREGMMMATAQVIALRGTCSRLRVGAVFAKEGRIIATGYNGAPHGITHCDHREFTWFTEEQKVLNEYWYLGIPDWMPESIEEQPGVTWYYDGQTVSSHPGCTVAEHAERNAIAFAAREGIALEGSTLYVTHAPCLECSRMLLNVGVETVYYQEPYRKTDGIDLLSKQGIPVVAWLAQS